MTACTTSPNSGSWPNPSLSSHCCCTGVNVTCRLELPVLLLSIFSKPSCTQPPICCHLAVEAFACPSASCKCGCGLGCGVHRKWLVCSATNCVQCVPRDSLSRESCFSCVLRPFLLSDRCELQQGVTRPEWCVRNGKTRGSRCGSAPKV